MQRGKFWPDVRRRMQRKAQQLFHREHPEAQGITPTKHELREGGYMYRAKLQVLREIYREKHGLSGPQEEMYQQQYQEWVEEEFEDR